MLAAALGVLEVLEAVAAAVTVAAGVTEGLRCLFGPSLGGVPDSRSSRLGM